LGSSEACDNDDVNPGKHVNALAKTLAYKPRLKYEHVDDLSLSPNFMEEIHSIDRASKEKMLW
jgi:hypothetical protein